MTTAAGGLTRKRGSPVSGGEHNGKHKEKLEESVEHGLHCADLQYNGKHEELKESVEHGLHCAHLQIIVDKY